MMQQVKKFIPGSHSINLTSDLAMTLEFNLSPFERKEGFTMDVISMLRDAPHGGEMHPAGDELVYVVSGCLEVTLELEEEEVVTVQSGEGIIIPQGVWHKVHVVEPAQLITIAPGPGFEYRELENL